jgi:hypothetical protein
MPKSFIVGGFTLVLALGLSQAALSQAASSQKDAAAAKSSQKANGSSEQSGGLATKHVDLSEGTKISAELVSSVDAQTAKPGDQVVARVTKNVKEHGQTVVKKGDELIGHVAQVQATGTANGGSSLGINFDQLVQGGTTSQLSTVVSSIISTPGERRAQQQMEQSEPMLPAGGLAGGGSAAGSARASGGGGGLLGGAASTVNSAAGATTSTVGSVASTAGSTVNSATGATTSAAGNVTGAATGAVNASSRTALGNTTNAAVATPSHAIHLSSQTQGSQQTGASSVLSTRKGDLRLDQGTEMQFRVAGSADAK